MTQRPKTIIEISVRAPWLWRERQRAPLHLGDGTFELNMASRTRSPRLPSGLGLAIAQWIVTVHHGEIRVESQLGRGAGFSVLLPLAD